MADPASAATEDMKTTPYWWDTAPAAVTDAGGPPDTADVVVIGSGFTALSAALHLARGGREVVVLEKAERAGFGCSTRNGGLVGDRFSPGYEALAAQVGAERAKALKFETCAAYDFLRNLIAAENIDCDYRASGHLICAHSPKVMPGMVQAAEAEKREFGIRYEVIPKAEQRAETGSDAFHGALLFPDCGGLNPMRYHHGLMAAARRAGVRIYTGQEVLGAERDPGTQSGKGGFTVHLAGRSLTARDVVIATNGYTTKALPWHRRRLIPIGSYIITTEEIDPAVMAEICPKGRMMAETRRVVLYYRPSPDGKRIVFGGRVAVQEQDARISAPRLREHMLRSYPALENVRLSHSWVGFVAFTFDHLPHLGAQDGMSYAMGYCGNGVPRATYYGWKTAMRILGRPEGHSALDDLPFQTRPLYSGTPWFLAPSIAWYKFRDWLA